MVDGAESSALLSTAAAAEILGVSASYVRRLISDDVLRATRVGRSWKISHEDLAQYQHTRLYNPVAQPAPPGSPGQTPPVLGEDDSWEIERSLLHAEATDLRLRLAAEKLARAEAEVDHLRNENRRLTETVAARDRAILQLLQSESQAT